MDKSIPQVEYAQDIQEMAKSADGPFSTRVPNASDTKLLYATVSDPSRPLEFKTSLEPASLAHAYELAHDPAKVGYVSDVHGIARSAAGPFSTRMSNPDNTAFLYATVSDPSRPLEIQTSLEPQARQAAEMSPVSGTNGAVSWQLPGSFQAAPVAPAPTKEVERSPKNEYDMAMGI
jgi:hypothetical protein